MQEESCADSLIQYAMLGGNAAGSVPKTGRGRGVSMGIVEVS